MQSFKKLWEVVWVLFVLTMWAPCNADKSTFDCKMRQLAMDYAHKIQPWLSDTKYQEIADALNGAIEAQHCNVSLKFPKTSPRPPNFSISRAASSTFYVDANAGSDSNSGTKDSPLQTISKAIMAVRSSGPGGVVVLRAGTFYLTETIMLDARDSGLTIQNYPYEEAIISGGKLIKPSWQAFNMNYMNVYVADLSSEGLDSMMGLRVNGKRAIRARYPNANPEIDGFGPRLEAQEWLPPAVLASPNVEENPDVPFRNSSDSFQKFQLGIGGTCVNFDPPAGYWCGSNTSGGGAVTYRVPSGMIADVMVLPNQPYFNPVGAVVQVWRPEHWASWMFEVGKYDFSSGTFNFSKGGFQGARGKDYGGEFYIENVMEELDSPNEWFYDVDTKMLYFFHNASSKDQHPANDSFVVPVLKTLLSVQASQDSPAKDITIKGLKFRDTVYTYMDPHGMPSGGDWGLQRSGGLFFEGTEKTRVLECIFERLDGNAIMISGYNRDATIRRNEFVWIGDTAIASWGYTSGSIVKGMGWDGTDGNQPRFNRILYNFVHELGIFEKQSSFYFQAKSCQNTIKGNIFFNGPRAGINFNDGFGGGSELTENLILNTCRESGDHGPFNSWDRQVFVTEVKTGSPSPEKEWDHIFKNFIIANYNSGWAIDNDDGSAYYKTHHNFLVYSNSGMKSDFGGHDNRHYNNIYAYSNSGISFYNLQLKGHEDYFYNNTVVQNYDGNYGNQQCKGIALPVLHDNKIYTPSGNVTECGMSLAKWQARGNDLGTVARKWPQDDDLIMMAKKLLEI